MERGTSRTTSRKHGREGRRRLEELDRSLRSTNTGVSGVTGISGPSLRPASDPRQKPYWTPVRKSTGNSDRSLRSSQDTGVSGPLTGVSGLHTPESPDAAHRSLRPACEQSVGPQPMYLYSAHLTYLNLPKLPLARGCLFIEHPLHL